MPLLSKTKDIWHIRYNSHQFLQMYHRKDPFWMYHSFISLLLWPRLQETTKGCECSPVHHSNQPPIHWLCQHFPLPRKSSQHNQGLHAPRTYSLPPSSVRKKIQKSEITYQPTSSLLVSDFWMDLPCTKLIFLYTLAMTVTLHSAHCPFLYEPYTLYCIQTILFTVS